ncbi:MAG: penicillin-binding transpeptidase domain-containing protein [Verrucomicrobiota bacterium]
MDRSHLFRRLWLLTWCLCLGFAVVAVRLVYVQFINPHDVGSPGFPDQEVATMRPALRGEIRDASGVPLVQSRLAVVVRADPVRIGPFAADVARLAAPLLALPESEVLARLQPVPVPHTNLTVVTNGATVVTNREIGFRPRRSNVVATNVSPAVWDHLYAALQTNGFPARVELSAEQLRLRERVRAAREALPWWDAPRRLALHRNFLAEDRVLRRRIREVEKDIFPCRRKGLFPEFVQLRRYSQDELAAHVLGFTTNDHSAELSEPGLPPPIRGAQGLEQRCDSVLQGSPGIVTSRIVLGREYVPGRARDVEPVDGMTVLLSLDIRIQEAVERALDDAMTRLNPMSMSAIVVRPSTGDILALANRPTFNPNNRRGESLESFKNRALTESFEPGSTFKVVTWSAVLEEGKASLDEKIDCHGGRWVVPGTSRPIQDVEGHHMGWVTVEEAFANSSNVGAVQLGLRLQTNQFLKVIRDFGFLARTDIECAELSTNYSRAKGRPVLSYGESAGRLPSWDNLTPSSLPFGYGLRVTPLQTVMAVAAIANGGVLMKPRLVRQILSPDNRVVWEYPPQQVRRVVSSNTAALMVRAMRSVVDIGSGKAAALDDFEVAGKTGTAKLFINGVYNSANYYASFVGFFPANQPEVAIIVTADRPTTAGKAYYGGKACAPVFRQIASEVANVLQLTPTISRTNSAAGRDLGVGAAHLARQP